MTRVKEVKQDSELPPVLAEAGSSLVVIDFWAQWCGPCRAIAPHFSALSDKYPDVVFVKVDSDQCPNAKAVYRISALPTFVFVRNTTEVERFSGADEAELEARIERCRSGGGAASASDSCVPGQFVLNKYLDPTHIECLNNSRGSEPQSAFKDDASILESDCDEQLLLSVGFTMPVKVHSLRILAPDDGRAPMTVKIFSNLSAGIDFDQAERQEGVQTLTFSPQDVAGDGKPVELRYVKFQNISNLTFFIKDNQGGEDTSAIRYLEIIGTPRDKTDMKEFKRIAGKAGEADH